MIIIPIKWLFHWEYTQHFQTNPNVNFPWMFFCRSIHLQPVHWPRLRHAAWCRLERGFFNELATKTGEVTYDPQNGHAVPTMTTDCMFLFNVKSYDPGSQVASLIWICFMAQNINHVAANDLRKEHLMILIPVGESQWFMCPICFNKPESTKSTMASINVNSTIFYGWFNHRWWFQWRKNLHGFHRFASVDSGERAMAPWNQPCAQRACHGNGGFHLAIQTSQRTATFGRSNGGLNRCKHDKPGKKSETWMKNDEDWRELEWTSLEIQDMAEAS